LLAAAKFIFNRFCVWRFSSSFFLSSTLSLLAKLKKVENGKSCHDTAAVEALRMFFP